jgi:glycosyltransferase involved in cell wall biosynthesis
MKILIVSERSTSFLDRYIFNLTKALNDTGVGVLLLSGEAFEHQLPNLTVTSSAAFTELSKTLDEHRYLEVFHVAKQAQIDHIHFCFFVDPQRLYLALQTNPTVLNLRFSYSIFGLAEYLRKKIYRNFHEKLLNSDLIKTILIHSDYPDVARATAQREHILDSPKVNFVHDPIYDEPLFFTTKQIEARKRLGLPEDRKIVLYFGTFFYKKGADLLLSAAEHFEGDPSIQFVFAGSTRTAPDGFSKANYVDKSHIYFDDRFIDDLTMAYYFAAADLIVLPYRRYYEHDTSGVLVQASLARKPILVPDISPFKETVADYQLGETFICEDVEDLTNQIRLFFTNTTDKAYGWEHYIGSIESWNTLANLIVS